MDPPTVKAKKRQKATSKEHSGQSSPEPVVSKGAAKTGSATKPVAEKTKRKQPTGSKKSATKLVVSKKTKRADPPGDPRANLRILNPTACAGKNTDVKKGTKLQIRYGRNKGTLYNATVTEVLNDERVEVCTQDKDPAIAKIQFKIVRLTEEQAKSDKPSGFTKGCANVGFAVAGAYDS
jgi:hypothetical protein